MRSITIKTRFFKDDDAINGILRLRGTWAGPFVLAVLSMAALVGCTGASVTGTTYDIAGEPLPGVLVHAAGSNREAVSSADGRYRVAVSPGQVVLNYWKTGYTPGQLELSVEGPGSVEAAAVTLWKLPPEKGVFLFEDNNYVATEAVAPVRYTRDNGEAIFGIDRWEGVVTGTATPVIMGYRVPVQGVRLHRMMQGEFTVTDEEGRKSDREIWRAAGTVPASIEMVDELEQSLLRIRPVDPLPAGTYAVGWGALAGETPEMARAYLFSVIPGLSGGAASAASAVEEAE